jgi:hypothetical protein
MSDTPLTICKRTSEQIVIDGRLDEKSWAATDPMILRMTDTGEPARYRTEARVLWDDIYLYVAFHCIDVDIWANMRVYDAPLWEEEVVEFFLDPTCTGRTYFELVINPLNVLTDVFVLNRYGKFKPLRDWNADGLRHAVTVDGDPTDPHSTDRSWTVECAVPFDQLVTADNIPPRSGDAWRGNFYRIEQGSDWQEYTAWSPTGEINFHHPEHFGTMVFSMDEAT